MRGPAIVVAMCVVSGACQSKRTEPAPAPVERRVTPPRPMAPPARAVRATSRPQTALAWSYAEAVETPAAWTTAADAYARERDRCVHDCADEAYAVVLAHKNALLADPIDPPPPGDEPVELPPRVAAVLDALDAYVAVADSLDPDRAGARFLGASLTTKWQQPDAVARLEALLREDRSHETAEYAANLLLDLLLRAERVDEARAWVDELLADAVFLADKPALRATLEQLDAMLPRAR